MSAATIDVPVFDLDQARCGSGAVVLQFPGRTTVRPPLRLTRRGRLAVTLTMASLLAAAGLVGASTALAGTTAGEPVAVSQVTVHPGQTLWEIAAAAAAPGEDVRDVIIKISELSGLSSSTVYAGQELTVPAP